MDEAQRLFEAGEAALPTIGDPKNKAGAKAARAAALLEKAFALGHVGAGRSLTSLLQFRDLPRSYACAVKLARMGDEEHLAGLLREDDLPPALGRETVAAAERGEPWAETTIATVLLNVDGGSTVPEALGIDVRAPAKRMREWLERAAKRGWAAAQWRLALALEDTHPARACKLAGEAVRGAQNVELLRNASTLHVQLLEATKRPLAELVPARQRLADGGDEESMVWVGDRHRLGEGAPRNFARAREWYERASARGSAAGHRELGKLFEAGEGVVANDDRAREHYETAAEIEGDEYARQRLATKWGLREYAVVKRKKKRT